MNKNLKLLTILFIFNTFISVSQNKDNNTIKPNININASELTHYLSKEGDSLLLKCDYGISSVQFIQGEFDKIISINNNTASIGINDLPYGKFTVSVTIPKKMILFNLYRDTEDEYQVNKKRDKVDGVGLSNDPNAKLMSVGRNSISVFKEISIIGVDDVKEVKGEVIDDTPFYTTKNRYFYVIESTINGFGSSKSWRMVNESEKDVLIRKSVNDLETIHGSRNGLIVWELYDISSFMKSKGRSKEVSNISHKFYNPKPIYDSANK